MSTESSDIRETYPVVRLRAREPVVDFRVVDIVSVDVNQRAVGQAVVGAEPVVSRSDNCERGLDSGSTPRQDVEHQTGRNLHQQQHPNHIQFRILSVNVGINQEYF